MTIKESIGNYFVELGKMSEILLMTPFDGLDDSLKSLTYGGKDSEGYIRWKPQEIKGRKNFDELEGELGFGLRLELKDYLNSYWFITLQGFYNGYEVVLDSVTPNKEDIIGRIKKYQNNSGEGDYIPIGIEGNGGIIVYDNITGEIYLDYFDEDVKHKISDGIESLIRGMKVIK